MFKKGIINMKDFLQFLFAGAVGALVAYFNVLLVPLCVLMAGTYIVVCGW
jgi:hypothetical protein